MKNGKFSELMVGIAGRGQRKNNSDTPANGQNIALERMTIASGDLCLVPFKVKSVRESGRVLAFTRARFQSVLPHPIIKTEPAH